MRGFMDRVFNRYGTEAVLHTGEDDCTVRVFFDSVNSKSQQNMRTQQHPLGKLPKGQYVCRFPAGAAVKAGDWVKVKESSYVICRVEDMMGPGGCVYRWALCTGRGGEDNWR